MFRHVVMFRWTADSTAEQQQRAVAELRAFGEQISDLGVLRAGVDAGLAEGNFDAVVVVDFADRAAYLEYATDPRHTAMIAEFIAPVLGTRVAVQTEFD